jgi:hypothetical protein
MHRVPRHNQEKTVNEEIGMRIRSTSPVVLFCGCLSTTTPEELSDKLYGAIGLDVPADHISIKADERGSNFSAIVLLDRNILAPFIEMCLKSVGETIKIEPATKRMQRANGLKMMPRDNVQPRTPSDIRHTEAYVARVKEPYGDKSEQFSSTMGEAARYRQEVYKR